MPVVHTPIATPEEVELVRGKGKRTAAPSGDAAVAPLSQPQKKRPKNAADQSKSGHRNGASNYTSEESLALLNILEEALPLGADAWDEVGKAYNQWAKSTDYAICEAKPLKQHFEWVSNCIIWYVMKLS